MVLRSSKMGDKAVTSLRSWNASNLVSSASSPDARTETGNTTKIDKVAIVRFSIRNLHRHRSCRPNFLRDAGSCPR